MHERTKDAVQLLRRSRKIYVPLILQDLRPLDPPKIYVPLILLEDDSAATVMLQRSVAPVSPIADIDESPTTRHMDRRKFISHAGIGLSGLALADRLLAEPYAPTPVAFAPSSPLRIRGTVTGGGRGLAGVRVSDGVSVVRTTADGSYALIADSAQPFVFVSTPAGWQPVRNATGTARFYQPIMGSSGEMRADFALVPRAGDAKHTMLVLADPQTRTREETDLVHSQTVPDVLGTIAGAGDRAILGVACGDIMFDDLTLYPEWERAVQRMGVPFYQVIGNHDLDYTSRTDEGASETFRSRFGPTAYSFDVGAIHYVMLDNVFWHGAGYLGYLDGRQLAWMAADLATIERGRTVVVLMHIPALSTMDQRRTNAKTPGTGSSVMNREALYRLLEPFKSHIVSGHQHELEQVHEGGPRHIVAGAVCGAWWSGPICYDGTPNGYLVLQGDDAAVSWQYKSTGLPAEHQIRGYKRGADRTAPDEVVANVWAWDDSWRVTWFEDGQPRGAMARRRGFDPLSVELHTGPDLPKHNPWVDPAPTAHLFYATPSREAREVIVEARDAAGRTFRERITV